MSYISNITRPEGDPKVLHSGRSSLGVSDKLSRALGCFSLGLGVTQLLTPQRITQALGMEGNEGLVRAYGAREIGSGLLSLSLDKQAGLWSRVAGDALDIATVATAMRPSNRKIGNVMLTLTLLAGITAIDVLGAQAVTMRHMRRAARARSIVTGAGSHRAWRRRVVRRGTFGRNSRQQGRGWRKSAAELFEAGRVRQALRPPGQAPAIRIA